MAGKVYAAPRFVIRPRIPRRRGPSFCQAVKNLICCKSLLNGLSPAYRRSIRDIDFKYVEQSQLFRVVTDSELTKFCGLAA